MTQGIVGECVYRADKVLGPWIERRQGGVWRGGPCIGVLRGRRFIAAVCFEEWNGVNVFASIAAEPKSGWATRSVLFQWFHYAFDQLGATRITTFVNASNDASVKLTLRLGFRPEATLRGAGSDGGDLLIFAMFRHECRWIGGAKDGQGQDPEAA